jgi:high-affinity nickel-transport protein
VTAELATTVGLGLALGLRHATDPDHVVAMGTIVTRDARIGRAMRAGLVWGVGHTTTVVAVGLALVVFGVRVPERVSTAMDVAVAVMLVALGVVAIVGRTPAAGAAVTTSERVVLSPVRPLLVGVVHGLAGSAALSLVALTTIPSRAGALAYLVLFGLGTVVGMVLVTAALAASLRFVVARRARVAAWIVRASGVASVAAGALVLAQLA